MEELKKRLLLENRILERFPFDIRESIIKHRVRLDKLVELCREKPKILDVCPEEFGLESLCKEAIRKMGFVSETVGFSTETTAFGTACELMKELVTVINKIEMYYATSDTPWELELKKSTILETVLSYKWKLLFPKFNEKTFNFIVSGDRGDEKIVRELVWGHTRRGGRPDLLDAYIKKYYVDNNAIVNELLDEIVNMYEETYRLMNTLSEEEVKERESLIEEREILLQRLLYYGGDLKFVIDIAVQLNMISLLYKLFFDNTVTGLILEEGLKRNRRDVFDLVLEKAINYNDLKLSTFDNLQSIFAFIDKFVKIQSRKADIYEGFLRNLFVWGSERLVQKILSKLDSGKLPRFNFEVLNGKDLVKVFNLVIRGNYDRLLNSLPKDINFDDFKVIFELLIKYNKFDPNFIYKFMDVIPESDIQKVVIHFLKDESAAEVTETRDLVAELTKQLNDLVKIDKRYIELIADESSDVINKFVEETLLTESETLLTVVLGNEKFRKKLDLSKMISIAIRNDLRNGLKLLTEYASEEQIERGQKLSLNF
jgi:hypothetical protein